MVKSSRTSAVLTGLRPWLLAPLMAAGCAATQTKSGDGFHSLGNAPANAEPTWTEKLAAPFKGGTGSIAGDNRQSTANDRDSLSLANKPNKKNPDLIIAVAQMSERAGKYDEAEKQYQKALKLAPKHLDALVGYAHLQDRLNKLDEATTLYQKAVAAHPKEAAVHNDLGLCYHRRGMLKEAEGSLSTAVELAPDRKLYRNNLATVMVEQGRQDQAFVQLAQAHGQAAGHYNLGYLLMKKGDQASALSHFQQAAVLDPSLTAAHQWVAKLTPQSAEIARREQIAPEGVPVSYGMPPQPATGPEYLQGKPQSGGEASSPWPAPGGVQYPNQQPSAYTTPAAVPPTPSR